jgi:cytochrome c-type biogenesis protein CcmH
MVCQNQSIDDSDAPLARDLRLLVRERLKAGDSDTQVLDFLTARYGQFVLLKPRFGWDTALLWLAPAGVLLAGVWGLVALLRRRRASPLGGADVGQPGLTAAERGRLAQLLDDGRQSTGEPS